MLVKFAIPVVDGRISGHFGETKSFAIVEANRQTHAMVRTRILAAPPHEPGSLPRWLREQGIQILIVGDNGIGRRALDYLVHHGIQVFAGEPGTSVESLIAACLEGRLPQMRRSCDKQHEPADQVHDCRLAACFQRQADGD